MIEENKKLYIIILNWNGTNDTIECLKSVRNNSYNNYQIVLVDNGSEYASLSELKSWCDLNFKQIAFYNKSQAEKGGLIPVEELLNQEESLNRLVFIENNENLGFAAGNNVALNYMLKFEEAYAILLNNDTVIEIDSLLKLVTFLDQNPTYVAATPQIRYFDPNDLIWNCGGKITWFGNRRYYYAKKNIAKVPSTGFKRITFITGCALIFKPYITGVLTEKFFFGEEDLDFSFRQKINKRKIACCFDSVIYHKVNASINKVNVKIVGHVYLHYLSRFINNKQYSSPLMLIIKIIVNLSYGLPMMRIRYKISFKQIYFMTITIVKELNRIDKIDREYCFNCLKEDFKQHISWNI